MHPYEQSTAAGNDCAVKTKSVSQSPIANARTLTEEVHVLAARLGGLADALCGPCAEASDGEAASTPAGLLPNLDDWVNGARRAVDRAHDAINRIERELP